MANKKTNEKNSKKKSWALFISVLLIVIGGVGGFFAAHKLTAGDKFEIIGEKTIEITIGSEYIDEGAVAISFGKDISDKIKVDNTVDTSVAGQYYVRYTVDNFRFKGIERYRTVIVVEVENEGV